MMAKGFLVFAATLYGVAASSLARGFIIALERERARAIQGQRGEVRRLARQQFWFRLVEGPLVVLGVGVGSLRQLRFLRERGHRLTGRLRSKLLMAGLPLGLSPDEFIGVVVVLSLSLGLLGRAVTSEHASGMLGLVFGLVCGVMAPFSRLDALYAERAKDAMRDIPRAMDLAGLCMSAGMDFTAALRTVVEMDRGTVTSELATVLRGLELGLTRRVALYALMERLPCTEVRDFCRAVAQADQKGASLAVALTQQARLCRMRRSLRAEENASKAAVLLIGPMMLLLVAILSVLVGPLLIGGVGL